MQISSVQLKKIAYLFITVLPITIGVGILKFIFHYFSWELIGSSLFPFLSSAFAGTFFFLGFMLAGVLADFKESEKLPSDLYMSNHAFFKNTECMIAPLK